MHVNLLPSLLLLLVMGGDMSDDLCDELLDDMDFVGKKVKCRKIEMMMPRLNNMAEEEMKAMGNV